MLEAISNKYRIIPYTQIWNNAHHYTYITTVGILTSNNLFSAAGVTGRYCVEYDECTTRQLVNTAVASSKHGPLHHSCIMCLVLAGTRIIWMHFPRNQQRLLEPSYVWCRHCPESVEAHVTSRSVDLVLGLFQPIVSSDIIYRSSAISYSSHLSIVN